MGVKATQPEGPSSEDGLDGGNGKGTEGEERIEYKIQDVLVPWVLRSKSKPKPKPKSKPKSKSSSTLLPNRNDDQNENASNGPVVEKEEQQEKEEEEEEEEEKVFNRYYHLFIEGELRDLIYKAGEEEGYRILPSPCSATSAPTSTSTSTDSDPQETESTTETGRWLRIRGEGWEADNWWVEAEVGSGDGQ
jgi:tRNA (uracil-5-)-methyltransferase TRM9